MDYACGSGLRRMHCLTASSWSGHVMTALLLIGLTVGQHVLPDDSRNSLNGVHDIDFIDLDDPIPSLSLSDINSQTDEVKISTGQGHIVMAGPRNDVIVDDEEFFSSGSGSGSGDLSDVTDPPPPPVMTPTSKKTSKNTSKKLEAGSLKFKVVEGGRDNAKNSTDVQKSHLEQLQKSLDTLDQTFVDTDSEDDDDFVEDKEEEEEEEAEEEEEDEEEEEEREKEEEAERDEDGDDKEEDDKAMNDVVYDDAPASSLAAASNSVISPPEWTRWSAWFEVNQYTRMRTRECRLGKQLASASNCKGARMQAMTCEDKSLGICGPAHDVTQGEDTDHAFVKAATPPTQQSQAPPTGPKPRPDKCRYSLYDTHRHKFVFSRWNLTQLITRSKVKKWCDRSSGQYIVMTTPEEHCRRYHRDLCKVSQRCRSNKPTKERGDFAEGCWRPLVYGDMLPIGLSNTQTIVYFICQRFAQESAMGKRFGSKHTHFGTLYDTALRSPVLSLVKMTTVGDQTWPETDYFIEHGLVENKSNMLWFFRRPKKGMLTLADLDRCHDDQSCDVGLRQILPQDYREPGDSQYTPTHLIWPELMPPSPAPRLSTFTMTNMAPLISTLFSEWHEAVRKVRRFAIEECGVPLVLDSNLKHLSELTSHRLNKSAMFVASGIIPSRDPVVTSGHDVQVPFLFWMAGCCVQQHSKLPAGTEPASRTSGEAVYGSSDESQISSQTNISAFAVYLRNAPLSHVIAAPVLQLEILLQDSYKTKPTDPDVELFPGHESACGDLKNDGSKWFM